MGELSNFYEALHLLEEKEVLFFIQGRVRSYVAKRGNIVVVKNEQSQYKLSIEEFEVLFGRQTFYLHESSDTFNEEEMLLKDKEYYSFKHK